MKKNQIISCALFFSILTNAVYAASFPPASLFSFFQKEKKCEKQALETEDQVIPTVDFTTSIKDVRKISIWREDTPKLEDFKTDYFSNSLKESMVDAIGFTREWSVNGKSKVKVKWGGLVLNVKHKNPLLKAIEGGVNAKAPIKIGQDLYKKSEIFLARSFSF